MCLGEFKCTLQGLLAKNSIFINIWWKIVDSFGCPQFISSRAISSAWEKNVLRISCWNLKLIFLLLDCFLSGNPPWQAIIMLQRMPYIFKTSIFSPSHGFVPINIFQIWLIWHSNLKQQGKHIFFWNIFCLLIIQSELMTLDHKWGRVLFGIPIKRQQIKWKSIQPKNWYNKSCFFLG